MPAIDPLGRRLHILVDNREKAPLVFPGHQVSWTTLRYGDYSAIGLKAEFEIERKSTPDLIATLIIKKRWSAFLRKLERWQELGTPMIVLVEGNCSDVYRLNKPTFDAMQGMKGIDLYFDRMVKLSLAGVHFLYAGDRTIASSLVRALLARELESRLLRGARISIRQLAGKVEENLATAGARQLAAQHGQQPGDHQSPPPVHPAASAVDDTVPQLGQAHCPFVLPPL